ncbi:hypothetical protein AAKU61_003729 [Undibacterium sp. GrIS 1.2]|uniref:hypothetical protein n=1 Tax=Undibacterium sp. GrIS 1.2 TaxID=3143933 RepID=UPI003396635D
MISNESNKIPDFSLIPADFPSTPNPGSLTGFQAKVLFTEYEGQFYPPGTTPPERFQRWEICEDLARQFSEKSLESKAGKRAHMSEQDILQQYYDRLLTTGWVAPAEAMWIIQRTAAMISWPQLIIE